MTWTEVLTILGVFAGGAAPWLEAIVVIPAGIVAGLDPAVAVAAGLSGNLLTVALAAWFGEWMRERWVAWRRKRTGRDGSSSVPADEPAEPSRRSVRVRRIARRWGMPALAVLGPIGLGTQISAAVAVGLGTPPRTAFGWVAAGTVGWSLVAAAAAVTGMSIAGMGA